MRKVTPYCELRSFSRTVRVRVLAVAGLRGESQVHCFPERDLFFSLLFFFLFCGRESKEDKIVDSLIQVGGPRGEASTSPAGARGVLFPGGRAAPSTRGA